jgi:hypothetical protein
VKRTTKVVEIHPLRRQESACRQIRFAECQKPDTRQIPICRVPDVWHSAKLTAVCCRSQLTELCRVSLFAECPTLGKTYLCRVSVFAECLALGKVSLRRVFPFTECGTRQISYSPSARRNTLGKTCGTRQRRCLR